MSLIMAFIILSSVFEAVNVIRYINFYAKMNTVILVR